jgi:hypothetical protein
MLIYANPSTRPKKATTATKARKPRAVKKGASAMAKKHRSAAQKAATRRMLAANNSRKRYRNPAPRKATRSRRRYANPAPRHHRRRVHRNPGSFTKGILGELASMDGLMLLGTAALAPTVVDMAAAAIVPVQYQSGWTGLLAKAALAAAGAYAIDRFTGKRKAAVGFAVGAGGSLIALAYRTFQAQNTLPAAVTAASPATADEIARNPTLYRSLMDGNDWSSLNEYAQAPSMNSYVAAPMSDEWESLN